MIELQGIPVSPGVAIAPALILGDEGYRIQVCQISAEETAGELARLRDAIAAVSSRLDSRRAKTAETIDSSASGIFSAQQQMVHDPRLRSELERRITDRFQSAPYAVSRALSHYAQMLRQLNSPFLSERAEDVLDVEKQLMMELGAFVREPLATLDGPVIVLAHALTPSETAGLDREKVRGFCTETGGAGGHTAIVAKGLELPAVVGIGPFFDQIGAPKLVIVDGDRGRLILDPDEKTLQQYQQQQKVRDQLSIRLAELRSLPAETSDGVRIRLSANIEFPQEVASCIQRGADGVGLYRTEFLYLGQEKEPTEDDHFEAYAHVVREMKGRPVVIRTLDLGADKMGHRPLAEAEHNPFLGLRSIRLALKNPDLFRIQLRAVLRAAALGDIHMMFPLITTLSELRQARMLLNVVAEDLREEGVAHRSDIPIGMMVEVPAAVVMLDRFIKEVNFISIGTNDLVQYALAVDRSNEYVADLYQTSDPAVLRLIQHTVQIADANNTSVSVCGEMSSNPGRALLLLGLGVRSLSVPPQAIPKIKKTIRSVNMQQCREIAERVMTLENAREVDVYLGERLASLAPEMAVI
jgi:phosphoenolpyruvate-protein phosphotransferase (PTS system enzyme I)